MTFKFKGRPVTKTRLGWWLRIFLTKLFGRNVNIEGRETPLRILPWIHKGRLLLMGAQHEFLQIYFTNQYTTEVRAAPVVLISKINAPKTAKSIYHIVLCHQAPDVVKAIYQKHASLSTKYNLIIAYGGPRENYDALSVREKYFIEDLSLRGPSHLMCHYELLEGALDFLSGDLSEHCFFFSESDLVPLRSDYLEPAISAMNAYDAQFLGKQIRDITSSNNGFFADAVSRGTVGYKSQDNELVNRRYFHCLGCFFAIDGSILHQSIAECRKMRGLYFEVMFPTAAASTGARLLSMDMVSDYLEHIRYRPFFTMQDVKNLESKNVFMIHPCNGNDLIELIK